MIRTYHAGMNDDDLSDLVGSENYQQNFKSMESKKWWQSWTIWFNILLAVGDFVNALMQIVPLPAGLVTYLGVIGNILLRLKTSKSIL